MSPDWDDDPSAVPYADFGNPQTLNQYAYGRNNPLRYADPDGHDVNVCDNSGQCKVISNDAYTAAQKAGNGGLNVPTLNQVGMNGNGSGQFNSTAITDANGNSVGSATYVSNGGADYYANRNGIDNLAMTGATIGSVKGVAAFYGASLVGAVGLYAAGATAGGELVVTGIEGDSSAIQFGKTAEQAAHALRHVVEEGLNPQEVQAAIKADIVNNGGINAGSNTRYIDVAGKTLRYNAYRLADGTINVGKIVIH